MKKVLKISGVTVLVLIIIAFIGMKVSDISPIGLGLHDEVSSTQGVAAGGYDVVAYFNQNEAVIGDAEFIAEHDGLNYRFSSAENLELFESNAYSYLPHYGGHCSFAVVKGFAVPGNPTFWTIRNDKLLFFANGDVKTEALEDIDKMITEGDENWK